MPRFPFIYCVPVHLNNAASVGLPAASPARWGVRVPLGTELTPSPAFYWEAVPAPAAEESLRLAAYVAVKASESGTKRPGYTLRCR